jgi:hypothetical protein
MTRSEAAAKFRATIKAAIDTAKWDGLTEQEIAAILAGEAIR